MADSTIEEIEQLVTPFCYSAETPFPTFEDKSNQLYKFENGTIADSSDWGYIYSDRYIQCFPIDNSLSDCHHKSKLQVNLSIPSKPFTVPRGAYIKCVTEVSLFKPKSWGSGLNRLLLGFGCSPAASFEEDESSKAQTGAVAIYDQVQQQILKWIPVPEPVTSMKVVAHWDSGDSSKPFFNPAMMTMVGIVTVGMSGGRVMVVDLGLDRLVVTAPRAGLLQPSVESMDSVQLHEPIVVDPFDRQIATKRHYATQSNGLICFYVGDSSETRDFLYIVRDGQSAEYSANMDRNNLSVVAIDYVPNIGCLLVGFNFGGFQLWRMEELALMYSAVAPEVEVPVHSFGFQQPIDDPKNFCYVWVLYGSRFCDGPSPRLDLYQLFFLNKSQLSNFGCIYQDLQKFVRNMSISLEDYFFALKAEDSMDESLEQSARGRYPLRLTIRNELMIVSWKVDRVGVFYVGIFDLNTWYSSHTPSGIPSGFGIAPFWVAIPVERSRALESELWDFRTVPSSIQRWENKYQPTEFHSYPASITFQGACLTSEGYYTFDHFGVQEKIVRLLSKDGPLLMAEPSRLLQYCLLYGLQPRSTRVYDAHSVSEKDAARFQILTILLENKRPAIIVQMANAWLDGSYSNVGCSVNLILDWIRDLSLSVRSVAEQHWVDLFTVAQANLLPDTIDFISYSNFVWNSLHSLLSILVRHDEVYNSARSGSLDSLRYSLKKLVEYSAAMQMFYQAKILPSDESALKTMNQLYVNRRQAVKDTRARMDFIPSDYKDKYGLLVIDELVSKLGEDLVRQEWKIDEEDYLYPPKHTAYVLNMLLWKDVDLGLVSRVMFYFIMDYICAAELPSSILKGDFGAVIQLDGEEHQEVYNMWRIDRGYVDEPLAYMVQRNVLAKPNITLSCWSAAMIILVGSDGLMESDVLNLLNLGCPIELPKLYYAVLGRIPHMQDQLMKFFSNTSFTLTSNEQDQVTYFLQVALEQEFLNDFITRYLLRSSGLVQELLLDFLRQEASARVKSLETYSLLLNYYTTMGKTEEAERMNSTMRTMWGEGTLLSAKQKQMWTKLQTSMRTGANQTKDSMVMSFLKNEVSANVPLCSPLTVKPKKHEIMQAVPKRLIRAPLFQSSPLRKYIPPKAKTLEQEESAEDEMDVTTSNDEEIEKVMNSLLRTPSVDHRRPRVSDAASRASSILSELSAHADTETHSILKKSPTKTPAKLRPQLRTRFIDPTSGQEIMSPNQDVHAFIEEGSHPLVNVSEYISTPQVLEQEPLSEEPSDTSSYKKRLRSQSPTPPIDADRSSKSPSPKRRSLRSPRLPKVQEETRPSTPLQQTTKSKTESPSTSPSVSGGTQLPSKLENEVDVLQESISTPDKSIQEDVFLTPTSATPKGKKTTPSPQISPKKAERTSLSSPIDIPFHVAIPEPVKSPGEIVVSSENLLVDPVTSKISVTEDHGTLKTLNISLAFDTSQNVASVVTDAHNILQRVLEPETGNISDVSNVNFFETTAVPDLEATLMDIDTESDRAADKNDEISHLATSQAITDNNSKKPASRKRAKSTAPESPSPTSTKGRKRTKSEVVAPSNPKRNVRRALVTDKVPRPKNIPELPVSTAVNTEPTTAEVIRKETASDEQKQSVLKCEKMIVVNSKLTRTNLVTGASASVEQTLKSESKAVTKTISPKKISEVVLGGESLLTDDESDGEGEQQVTKKKRAPRKKKTHEDSVDGSSDSFLEKTFEDPMQLGPRRLTRKQKTMLESIGMGEISSMGDANLTPPKHSPEKNKSPAKSGGRKKKGKSGDDDVSVDSSEHELEKSVSKRSSRRSMTPVSDISQVSERRVTRSSHKKTDDMNSSVDETSENVGPTRSTRSRRSKTPSLNLTTIFEKTSSETLSQPSVLDESLSIPGKSRRKNTRAASEPPTTQPKRKTSSKKKEVMEFEPNVSTIHEVSQERSTLDDTKLNTSSSRTRKRPSKVESITEEAEPEAETEANTSRTTRSTRARSTRRSMTPSLSLQPSGEDVTVADRVNRRRHASTSSSK